MNFHTDFYWKNKILHNDRFKECCRKIKDEENNRIFCRHDISHFMDVARLMMIINFKEEMGISEKVIYATALLHDIGRHLQYQVGIKHEISSALIATEILRECGFSEKESKVIIQAILKHRDGKIKKEKNLNGLLYRADKMSRSCFCCEAIGFCNWSDDKKNLEIKY